MCEKTKTCLRWVLVAIFATLFAVVTLPGHGTAAAGINQQISFEGKIVNASGVNVPDGVYNLQFKIYQDGTGCVSGGSSPCGGTLKYTDTRLVNSSQGVTVTAGTFQVNLGSIAGNPLSGIDWNQDTLWLSMNVGGTTNTASPTWDGEMTPFIRLTAVPYALNAAAVGGLSASQLVQLTPGTQQTGTINVSGSATVGSLTVGSTAVVNGSGLVQSAAVSGSYTGITGLGTVTVGTWNASTLTPGYGGTGQSSYTVGDILYASGATTLNKLSDVATGQCLISGGVGVAPTWGSCGSAGANTALSNLASTAVNASIIPGSAYSNLIDLGSSSYSFRTGYFGTSVLAPTIDALTAGGTLNIGTTSATTLNLGFVGATATSGQLNISTTTGASQDVNIGGTGISGGSNAGTTVSAQGGATNLFIQNSGAGIQTYTNSNTAFQIQNSAGAPVLLVDTTSTAADGTTVNYLKYPGFETGNFNNAALGWAASSPATLSQNTAKANTYNGLYSARVVTTASNGGLTTSSFVSTPPSGTYIVSFYAEIGSGNSMASSAFSVATTGGTGSCTGMAGVTITTTGFQRVYCQLTASGAVTGLTITQNDGSTNGARTIYIDAVQMQSSTFNGTTITQATPYQIGAVQLRGVITNPVALINNGNSTAAFQIQNAGGNSNLFIADTLNNRIGIGTNAPSALLSVGATSQFQVDANGNIVASGNYNGNALTASTLTFSGSSTATIQSASGQNLALNTGTAAGTITTNAGTIQRTTSGGSTFTLDLNDTFTTNFKLFNSGSGVANLWLYGGAIYTGSGQTIRLDNSGNLSNIGTISSTGSATFNGAVQIGLATADATQNNLQLDSSSNYTDVGTCTTTAYQGAMYYNTATNAIRSCINGSWEDLISTAGLGILTFGVVADTGSTAAQQGDIGNRSSTTAGAGPCKVAWASATSVTVTACSAYSGGRKVVYAGGTLTGLSNTNGNWQHICFTATGTLAATTATATETANLPTWSPNNPALCIADIKGNGTTITIYDTRVFTNSQKTFAYDATAAPIGTLAKDNASATGATVVATAGAASASLEGVVVASSGVAWAAGGGPNVILATGGPVYVKAITFTFTAAWTAQSSATAGYAWSAAASTNAYANLGIAQTAFLNTCTSAANCNLSILVNENIK